MAQTSCRQLRPGHKGLWISCELIEPNHHSISCLKASVPVSTVAGTCEPLARGSSSGEERAPSNHPRDNSRFPAQQAQGWWGLCMPGSLIVSPLLTSGFLQREQSSPQPAGREISASTGAHAPPLTTAKQGVINSPPCSVTAAATLACGQLRRNGAGWDGAAPGRQQGEGGKVK